MADPRSQVFVSYASGDHPLVALVAAASERAGIRVWIARSGIPGGANYGPEIVSAIRQSGALVLCCTDAAFASRNVRQEIAVAWKYERPILPLLLDRVAVPEDLAYWLEANQWIEVHDRSEFDWLPEVLRGLERMGVSALPPHLAPLSDADAPGPIGLPTPLTALLGRDDAVDQIGGLLGSRRLVTLSGPGGVGKTRLAIEAARSAAPTFPDGVVFVDLAPLRDTSLVPSTIGRALGLRESPGLPPERALANAIGSKRILLVLDNMERVIEAAAGIAALLEACPRLVVLVTSRAVLGVRGEEVFPVETLSVPGATSSISELAAPAVRLFAERAAEARPGFTLTDGNAMTIAAICARLDGLPLAIELAAARIKLLTPEDLLAKLTRRLSILTMGARDLPDRQRTLRSAIAWSFDLLSTDEQALLRRLAVFSGGCTLEAADAVAGSDLSLETIDILSTLVDESLVRQSVGGGAQRFWLLETVREFGLERLAESGEEEHVRRHHSAWCVATAEHLQAKLVARVDGRVIASLDLEHDNMRAALTWLQQSGDSAGLLRLAGALGEFWQFRGPRREGLSWLERALDSARRTQAPNHLRLRALHGASWIARDLGDLRRATELANDYLALSHESHERRDMALATELLGYAALASGDYERAAMLASDAREQFENLSEFWLAGATCTDMAMAAYGRGDLESAKELLEESLARFRAIGDELYPLRILTYLGLIACDQGDYAEAAAKMLEGATLAGKAGLTDGLHSWLMAVAVVAAACGAASLAARLYGSAIAQHEMLGQMVVLPDREIYERGLQPARAALGGKAFAAAVAAGRDIQLAQALEEGRVLLADVAQTMHSNDARVVGVEADSPAR